MISKVLCRMENGSVDCVLKDYFHLTISMMTMISWNVSKNYQNLLILQLDCTIVPKYLTLLTSMRTTTISLNIMVIQILINVILMNIHINCLRIAITILMILSINTWQNMLSQFFFSCAFEYKKHTCKLLCFSVIHRQPWSLFYCHWIIGNMVKPI